MYLLDDFYYNHNAFLTDQDRIIYTASIKQITMTSYRSYMFNLLDFLK